MDLTSLRNTDKHSVPEFVNCNAAKLFEYIIFELDDA